MHNWGWREKGGAFETLGVEESEWTGYACLLQCRSTETPSAKRRPAAGHGVRRLSMEGAGQGGGSHSSGENKMNPFQNY